MIKATIDNAELQTHLSTLKPDGMDIFVAGNGLFRGALFHGTRFVNQMRAQHKQGLLETFMLGQACLSTALLIQTMKGRESLMLRYETDGAAKGFCTSVDSSGAVRGYLLQDTIPLEAPLESWDLAPFLGNGIITVSRVPELPNGKAGQVQTSSVEIKHRNIAQDLTWYFHQSDQIYTAFNTGIQFDTAGNIIGAGGLFIQRMPLEGGTRSATVSQTEREAEEEDAVLRMERALSACPPLGQWFSEKGSCEDIIYGLFREFEPETVFSRNVVFDCPCSQEYYTEKLKSLPSQEREKLHNGSDEPLEIICRNCSSVYHIPSNL